MKSEFHIAIAIEIPDSVSNIFFLQLSVAVFAKVLANLTAVKVPYAFSVNPLKSGIWFKIYKSCDTLSLAFNSHFSLPQVLKQCGKLNLCLEAYFFLMRCLRTHKLRD